MFTSLDQGDSGPGRIVWMFWEGSWRRRYRLHIALVTSLRSGVSCSSLAAYFRPSRVPPVHYQCPWMLVLCAFCSSIYRHGNTLKEFVCAGNQCISGEWLVGYTHCKFVSRYLSAFVVLSSSLSMCRLDSFFYHIDQFKRFLILITT